MIVLVGKVTGKASYFPGYTLLDTFPIQIVSGEMMPFLDALAHLFEA